MIKNVLKFFAGAVGIIILGLTVLYVIRIRLPAPRAMQPAAELTNEDSEDPYGGTTPEETMRLFIEALKKGDTKLAEKYFAETADRQLGEELAQIKDKNLLGEVTTELEQMRLTREDADHAYFTRGDANDPSLSQAVLAKYPTSGRWKIIEF